MISLHNLTIYLNFGENLFQILMDMTLNHT
jgi:hypothetical protein